MHTSGVSDSNQTGPSLSAVAYRTWDPSPMRMLSGSVNCTSWVRVPALTRNVRVTAGAAAYSVSSGAMPPAWVASMVHSPTPTRVMSTPPTVQTSGVSDSVVTGRPDVADTSSGSRVSPC